MTNVPDFYQSTTLEKLCILFIVIELDTELEYNYEDGYIIIDGKDVFPAQEDMCESFLSWASNNEIDLTEAIAEVKPTVIKGLKAIKSAYGLKLFKRLRRENHLDTLLQEWLGHGVSLEDDHEPEEFGLTQFPHLGYGELSLESAYIIIEEFCNKRLPKSSLRLPMPPVKPPKEQEDKDEN